LQERVVEEGWLKKEKVTLVDIPPQTAQTMVENHPTKVSLPEGATLAPPTVDPHDPEYVIFHFPEKCKVHHAPVPRRELSIVIALAVAAICLWGTLVGSMLPLVFRRFGVDPGIASSPFVATFVDVTGIVIYFSIAKAVLGDFLM
jgi:magnesium transporter